MFQKANYILLLIDTVICKIIYSILSTNAFHYLESKSEEDREFKKPRMPTTRRWIAEKWQTLGVNFTPS